MTGGGGLTCPKCGLEQAAAEECARCGVLFRKAHPDPLPHPAPPPALAEPAPLRARPAIQVLAFCAVGIALALLLRRGPAAFLPGGRPAPVAADGWFEGPDGFARAEAEHGQGRPMVLYFHTTWCGWCKRLDADYLGTSEVRAHLAGVPKVRIDPDRGSEEMDLARRYGVNGYPTLLVLPARGGGPVRVHPFFGERQMSVEEFLAALRAAE